MEKNWEIFAKKNIATQPIGLTMCDNIYIGRGGQEKKQI